MDQESIVNHVKTLSKLERKRFSANVSKLKKRKGLDLKTARIVEATRLGLFTDRPTDNTIEVSSDAGLPMGTTAATAGDKVVIEGDRQNPQVLETKGGNTVTGGHQRSERLRQLLFFALSSVVFVVLSLSLVFQSAKAFDYSYESWFYGFITEFLAAIWLCVHVEGTRNRVFIRGTGLLSIAVGFGSIYLGVKKNEDLRVLSSHISTTNSQNIDKLIDLKSSEIKTLQANLSLLSRYSNRSKALAAIDQRSAELEKLFNSQRVALESSPNVTAERAKNLSIIETMQRLITLLSSLIAFHSASFFYRALVRPRSGPDPPCS